jgi:carbohydrate-binding DOMON domain-containing protein
MQIRKKWLNQLKNFFNKHFENIIWHLFAGESHQVVKIIVHYCPSNFSLTTTPPS